MDVLATIIFLSLLLSSSVKAGESLFLMVKENENSIHRFFGLQLMKNTSTATVIFKTNTGRTTVFRMLRFSTIISPAIFSSCKFLMSWDWRKILEVLILGQIVIDKLVIHLSYRYYIILWFKLLSSEAPSHLLPLHLAFGFSNLSRRTGGCNVTDRSNIDHNLLRSHFRHGGPLSNANPFIVVLFCERFDHDLASKCLSYSARLVDGFGIGLVVTVVPIYMRLQPQI